MLIISILFLLIHIALNQAQFDYPEYSILKSSKDWLLLGTWLQVPKIGSQSEQIPNWFLPEIAQKANQQKHSYNFQFMEPKTGLQVQAHTIGGYLRQFSSCKRSFPLIPPHNYLQILLDIYLFDVWSDKQTFQISIDNQIISIVYSKNSVDLTQSANQIQIRRIEVGRDLEHPIMIPHNYENPEIRIQSSKKGNWGVANVGVKILDCHYTCSTCTGPGVKQCATCNQGFRRYMKQDKVQGNGIVVGQCECMDGYQDDGQFHEMCCSKSCQECIDSPDMCLKCGEDKNQNRDDLASKFQACPCRDGFYEDQTSSCLPCDASCMTCSGIPSNCLACDISKNRFLNETFQASYSCMANVFFQQTPQLILQDCPVWVQDPIGCQYSSCYDYSHDPLDDKRQVDPLKMIQCINKYYKTDLCEKNALNNEDCSRCRQRLLSLNQGDVSYVFNNQLTMCTCQDGYFEIDMRCEKCEHPCLNCVNSADNCIAPCPYDRQLKGNYCQCKSDQGSHRDQQGWPNCPCEQGYFEQNKICVQCHQTCQDCTGRTESNCEACKQKINGVELKRVHNEQTKRCDCLDDHYDYQFKNGTIDPVCRPSNLTATLGRIETGGLQLPQFKLVFNSSLKEIPRTRFTAFTQSLQVRVETQGSVQIYQNKTKNCFDGYNAEFLKEMVKQGDQCEYNNIMVQVKSETLNEFDITILLQQQEFYMKEMTASLKFHNQIFEIRDRYSGQKGSLLMQDSLDLPEVPISPRIMNEKKAEYRQQKDLIELAQSFLVQDGGPGISLFRLLAGFHIFSLMMNCLQVSLILLVLTIPLPLNFYNTLRIIGSFILPTLPEWGDMEKRWELSFFGTETEDIQLTKSIDRPSFQRIGFAQSYLITFRYGIFVLCVLYIARFICLRTKDMLDRRQEKQVNNNNNNTSNNIGESQTNGAQVLLQEDDEERAQKIENMNRLYSYISGLYLDYIEATLFLSASSALIDVTNPNFDSMFLVISQVFSFIMTIYYLGYFKSAYNVMSQEEDRDSMPLIEYKTLYEDLRMDFDPHNQPAQVFRLMSYLKKLTIIIIFRWVDDVYVLLPLQFIYFVYLWRLSPYKNGWKLLFRVVGELALLVLYIVIVIYRSTFLEDALTNDQISFEDVKSMLNYGTIMSILFFIFLGCHAVIFAYNFVTKSYSRTQQFYQYLYSIYKFMKFKQELNLGKEFTVKTEKGLEVVQYTDSKDILLKKIQAMAQQRGYSNMGDIIEEFQKKTYHQFVDSGRNPNRQKLQQQQQQLQQQQLLMQQSGQTGNNPSSINQQMLNNNQFNLSNQNLNIPAGLNVGVFSQPEIVKNPGSINNNNDVSEISKRDNQNFNNSAQGSGKEKQRRNSKQSEEVEMTAIQKENEEATNHNTPTADGDDQKEQNTQSDPNPQNQQQKKNE